MGISFRRGLQEYKVVFTSHYNPNAEYLRFPDSSSARDFLRDFESDVLQMSAWRDLAAEGPRDRIYSLWGREELLSSLASSLACGDLRVVLETRAEEP